MQSLALPSLVVLLLLAGGSAHSQVTRDQDKRETPPAVPARPTLTNPAHIPLPGYLQFEQGFLQANASPGVDHQFSIVQTTKLALTHHLMMQLGSQPWAFTRTSDGSTSRDQGDLIFGAQVLLTDYDEGYSRKPTVALLGSRRVHTGTTPDLDLGSFSQGVLVMISGSLFGVHYDSNAIFNEQAGTGSGTHDVRRLQTGETINLTRQLTKPLSLGGELWHVTQPLVGADRSGTPVARANAVGLLVTAAYNVRPNLVLDIGMEHGLTSTSTAWQGFAGFTYLLPHRLWHSRAE